MRYRGQLRLLGLCLSWCLLAMAELPTFVAKAATVWTGPLISYNQPAPDPTQATNQDRITPHVWLTRAASKGLFNAVTETAAGPASPADTEWAFGTLDNYSSLTYTNWLALLNGQSPVILVGQPLVLHLISDDIYLSIEFTLWGSHASGGFAYNRSIAPLPVGPTLSSPLVSNNQFTFRYTATPGQTYVVQASSNLDRWIPVVTNLAGSASISVTDTFLTTEPRFYRVEQVPNP